MTDEILTLDSLPCRIVADIELDDQRYVLLSPTRRLVTIVRDDHDGIEEVPPSSLSPVVKAAFDAELSKHDLTFEITEKEYVLSGELPDEVAELCDSITVGGDDDGETHLILADHEQDKSLFLLLTPELPPLFPAKVVDGKALALEDDELEKIESQLAAALESDAH